MINRALFRHEWARYRWWLAGGALFFLGELILFAYLAVTYSGHTPSGLHINWSWSHDNILQTGLFAGFFGGLWAYRNERHGALGFLLAKPLSRREAYDTKALAGGLAMALLMLTFPFYYLVLAGTLRIPFHAAVFPITLLDMLWVEVLFLAGIWLRLLRWSHSQSCGWGKNQGIFILLLVTVVGVLIASGWQTGGLSLGAGLIDRYPGALLLTGLAALGACYHFGRRCMELMDV